LDVDPSGSAFHFDADPDSTDHFDADPDSHPAALFKVIRNTDSYVVENASAHSVNLIFY
jgi:hypothetical protein